MNSSDVKALLDEIRKAAENHDNEKAHSLEEKLYSKVLRAIAHGNDDPQALARTALRAKQIKFSRWFA